jgi:hypothetical protein
LAKGSRLLRIVAFIGRKLHHLAARKVGKAMRRRTWSVYGPGIQAAVGEHLSAKQIDTLTTLLGALGGASSSARRTPPK